MLAPALTPLIAKWAGWSAGLYAGGALALLGVAVWFFMADKPAGSTGAEISEAGL
jgi:cyanate permease